MGALGGGIVRGHGIGCKEEGGRLESSVGGWGVRGRTYETWRMWEFS